MLSQLNELIPVIDKAEKAGDRWLFLASLAVLMIGGAIVIRWLVAALKAKDDDAAKERSELHGEIKNERAECRAQRKDDQTQFLVALAEKNAALQEHTKAIRELTGIITKHDTDMRAAHEIELRSIVRSEIEKNRTS